MNDKKTFKDFGITWDEFHSALIVVLGSPVVDGMKQARISVAQIHNAAMRRLFVYDLPEIDVRHSYVLRCAAVVLDDWGYYKDREDNFQ